LISICRIINKLSPTSSPLISIIFLPKPYRPTAESRPGALVNGASGLSLIPSRQERESGGHGLPCKLLSTAEDIRRFRTGDIVRAEIPKGKHIGTHVGKIVVRESGSFAIRARDVLI
jgi:hypothetical protein